MNKQRLTLIIAFLLCLWGVSQILRLSQQFQDKQSIPLEQLIDVNQTDVIFLKIGHDRAQLTKRLRQSRPFPEHSESIDDAEFSAVVLYDDQERLSIPFNVSGLIPAQLLELAEAKQQQVGEVEEVIVNDQIFVKQTLHALTMPRILKAHTLIIRNSDNQTIGRFDFAETELTTSPQQAPK